MIKVIDINDVATWYQDNITVIYTFLIQAHVGKNTYKLNTYLDCYNNTILQYNSSGKAITVQPRTTTFFDYYLSLIDDTNQKIRQIDFKIFNIRALIKHKVYKADLMIYSKLNCEGNTETKASISNTPYEKSQYVTLEYGDLYF